MGAVIAYNHESYSACLPELMALYPEHYEELSVTKDAYALDPDYEAYARMDATGILHLVTARDDGALVGYIMAMTMPNLHYRTCRMAVEDIYFLRKPYRKGRTGIRLFQYFERRMREIGVNRIVVTTKVHLDNSRLFDYLGYTFFERGYTKMLGV